ncbi:hypothetical protein B0H16DRAFT_1468167 [Mycena metata]|uniref:Uncharacterized protein n=1 Tax=Mycena metata TaxID=1033252 RepID=A0AAD7MUA4_9AGAR|nr:hypothetical protein B0H16DRAFT_1468167 [Mycena metata]
MLRSNERPPNIPSDNINAWLDDFEDRREMERPMHGALFINGQGPYSTSSPRELRRLAMEPGMACCDFLALEPHLGRNAGQLRVLESMQNYTVASPGQPFCESCRIAAQEAVDQFPGLQIRDNAAGTRYQSAATVR